jgi:glucan phosphorylase
MAMTETRVATSSAGSSLADALAARLALEPLPASAPLEERRRALFRALAAVCRRELAQRWARTQAADAAAVTAGSARRVHYLSMEFLIGRALGNALAALGCQSVAEDMLAAPGLSLSDLLEAERDAALGNGGLGRLAACFLDAFAEIELPSFGYGLRYEFGMFAQAIQDGRQVEAPDDWMREGEHWELEPPRCTTRWVSAGALIPMATVAAGRLPSACSPRVTTSSCRRIRASASPPCACGARVRPSRSTSPPSPAASTWRRRSGARRPRR